MTIGLNALRWASLIVLSVSAVAADYSHVAGRSVFIERGPVATSIRTALRDTELSKVMIEDSDVRFGAVPSTTEGPQLRVTSIHVNPDKHSLYVRIECLRRECLPFYASVYARSDISELTRISIRTENERQVSQHKVQLVAKGQSAKLVTRSGAVTLSVPVACLQTGGAGDLIRVRVQGTGKVMRARVQASSLLTSQGETSE